MTFEILTPTDAKLTSVTPRTEKHGDDDVFAISLGLSITGPNTMLDALSPSLRQALYMAVPGQDQLPGVEPATPLLRCKVMQEVKLGPSAFEGWTLAVDHGIDEGDPITLGGCKVDKFVVLPSEGGTVELRFRIGSSDIDATEAGLLCSHLGQVVSFTLKAPEARKPDAVIDGTGAEFKKDHPDAGDLFAAEHGGAGEGGDGAAEGAEGAGEGDGLGTFDDDMARGSDDTGAAEQAELEAGMRESIAAAGVKPKRGRAAAH